MASKRELLKKQKQMNTSADNHSKVETDVVDLIVEDMKSVEKEETLVEDEKKEVEVTPEKNTVKEKDDNISSNVKNSPFSGLKKQKKAAKELFSLRLSPENIEWIESMANTYGCSRAKIIETLIENAKENY